jgi:PIF1-like helicase
MDGFHGYASEDPKPARSRIPEVDDLVKILVSKRNRRRRTFEQITKSSKQVDVLQANGSVRSIMDFAIKARLDKKQRRAFEVIVGTFVLSFYPKDDPTDGAPENQETNQTRDDHGTSATGTSATGTSATHDDQATNQARGNENSNLINVEQEMDQATGTTGVLVPEVAGQSTSSRSPYSNEKTKLLRLVHQYRPKYRQLIGFVHGPGGCGKTTVIDLVLEYAREYCSYMEGFEFTSRTILVTAMTGVAATLLMGDTTHSALYLNQTKPLTPQQIELWEETRLLIIDEVSFASKGEFEEINKKLNMLRPNITNQHNRGFLPYGGLDIVFCGDLRQLEPVGKGKKPVYEDNCPEFRDWVNMYIELDGMHRFKNDMNWGALLSRCRNGRMTIKDIKTINTRKVSSTLLIPKNIKYATFYNKDRDSINAGLFEERCKRRFAKTGNTNDTIMIFCGDIKVRNRHKKFVPLRNRRMIWESCSEDDIKSGREARMDPVLRIYKGCRIMLPKNMNVGLGLANGTQAIVEKVFLKPGQQCQTVMLEGSNIPIRAAEANQVSHVLLRHTNDRIVPATFTLTPREHTVNANVLKPEALQFKKNERDLVKIKTTQLPILVNNATTGHKLQGCGVEQLFVHQWNYTANWPYVMLSRVKTMDGLFLREELSTNLKKYEVPLSFTRLIKKFRQRSPTYWNEDDYDEHFPEEVRVQLPNDLSQLQPYNMTLY